jgi:MFS family permease
VAVALLGTTVSLRAELDGFGSLWTGLVLGAYFAGLGLGGLFAGGLVVRVGHVRAVGALAAALVAAILLHALWALAAGWALARLAGGFCAAGLYIAAESWISERSAPAHRGLALAAYGVVLQAGGAIGHLLVWGAGADSARPFVVAATLVTLSGLPVLLVAPSREPARVAPSPLRLGATLRAAPVAMSACLASGVAAGATVTLTPVYATRLGMDVPQVARLMTAVVLGGILLQLPVGRLSDRIGRRPAILAVAVGIALASGGAALCSASLSGWALILLLGLFGGFVFSLYPTAASFAYERLGPERAIAAGGALMVVYAAGAALGPLVGTWAMEALGPRGLFAVTGGAAVLLLGRAVAPGPRHRQRSRRCRTGRGGQVEGSAPRFAPRKRV